VCDGLVQAFKYVVEVLAAGRGGGEPGSLKIVYRL
jgi:hypothetical protein